MCTKSYATAFFLKSKTSFLLFQSEKESTSRDINQKGALETLTQFNYEYFNERLQHVKQQNRSFAFVK